jgi:hypothetical protein
MTTILAIDAIEKRQIKAGNIDEKESNHRPNVTDSLTYCRPVIVSSNGHYLLELLMSRWSEYPTTLRQ